MMRSLIIIGLWLLFASVVVPSCVRPVFGVRVAVGANSSVNTFVCYIDNGRVLTHKRIVDEPTFIKIVSGYWPSVYNPQRINYFEEHKIGCGIEKDPETLIESSYCEPFDSLWKIRFQMYPFRTGSGVGWSNKLHKPSLHQDKYIYDRYGVKSVDMNFFLDTSFWLLLQDVQDPDWIANYRSLK